MGAQRTWTNLLFLILRQITRIDTDKPRSSETKNQVSLLSVLVVKSVVKISPIQEFFNHNGSAADMDELTFSNPSSNHTDGHG
jgi:hypothetical protein